MKVYVDEFPKCCLGCKLACPYEERCVDTTTMNCDECVGRPKSCPLQSLSDYTKQVRKEVCEEIRDIAKKLARPTTEYDDKTFDYDIDAVTLDHILIWFKNGGFDLIKGCLD